MQPEGKAVLVQHPHTIWGRPTFIPATIPLSIKKKDVILLLNKVMGLFFCGWCLLNINSALEEWRTFMYVIAFLAVGAVNLIVVIRDASLKHKIRKEKLKQEKLITEEHELRVKLLRQSLNGDEEKTLGIGS